MQKQFSADATEEQMHKYLQEHDADECEQDCLECGTLKSCYFLNWCLQNFPERGKQIVAITCEEDSENGRIQQIAELVGLPIPYVLN